MMQSSDESPIDLIFLTKEEQSFSDLIPFVWSEYKDERDLEVEGVIEEMKEFLLKEPNILPFALKKLNALRNQSPFIEFMEYFYKFGIDVMKESSLQQVIHTNLLGKNLIVKKKRVSKYFQDCELAELQKISEFLSQEESSPHFHQVVRKLKLTSITSNDSDWNVDELTYDPSQTQKNKLNIFIMKNLSFNKLKKLLCDLYAFGNQKITNLSQISLMFPDYLKNHMSIIKKVFSKKYGIMHQDLLILLAILASAGQECKYMIHEMTEKFIMIGGDQSKIQQGYRSFYPKIRKLAYFYRLLSQQPAQLLGRDNIIYYLIQFQKGLDSDVQPMNDQIWTKSQIMQAIIMFAIIQCECTIQQALGIQNEITCTLEERISLLAQNQPLHQTQINLDKLTHILSSDTTIEFADQEYDFQKDSTPTSPKDHEQQSFDFSTHFLGDPEIVLDYWQRKDDLTTDRKKVTKLSSSQFNWITFRSWLTNLTKDTKFNLRKVILQMVQQMTFNKLGNISVSTVSYREAIIRFSQLVIGYTDDSYDYNQIKMVLPISLQNFIRKIIHNPGAIKSIDYDNIQLALKPEDFVHTVIIVSNAKLFAQILIGFSVLIDNHNK